MAEPRATKTPDTPAEATPAATRAPSDVQVPEAPRRRSNALAIAGIAVGSVLVAGALFGGGIAVGVHLPSGGHGYSYGPSGPSQNGFGTHNRNGQNRPDTGQRGGSNGSQTGPNGLGRPGPVNPGENGQQQGGTTN